MGYFFYYLICTITWISIFNAAMELTSSVWFFLLAELILAWRWEALFFKVTTVMLELRKSDLR